jgi:hypothetical protein
MGEYRRPSALPFGTTSGRGRQEPEHSLQSLVYY